MITNYMKLAWRNLVRNKAFSFINIMGLSVGLTTCLLIMLYIADETRYDKHHKDANQIFRIASVTGTGETWAAAPAPLAWALKNDLPEVQQVTRLLSFPDIEKMLLKYEQGSESRRFYESGGYYVDSTFFQVFTYEFIYGNAATALNEPNSLVISDNIAQKFFGNKDAVGKALVVNTPFGDFNYKVTGVFNSEKNKTISAPITFCRCGTTICGIGCNSKQAGAVPTFSTHMLS
jgi:putative ABC transport system permease protein